MIITTPSESREKSTKCELIRLKVHALFIFRPDSLSEYFRYEHAASELFGSSFIQFHVSLSFSLSLSLFLFCSCSLYLLNNSWSILIILYVFVFLFLIFVRFFSHRLLSSQHKIFNSPFSSQFKSSVDFCPLHTAD